MPLDSSLNQFRLASRELFNHYFRTINIVGNEESWRLVQRFREVEEILFVKLVTEDAAIAAVRYGEVQPEISVALRNGIDIAPIMVNRDIDSGYWDYPLTEAPYRTEMLFVNFFDWDQMDYRDNKYVHVQLITFPGHPEVTRKHALIESQSVQFSRASKP